MIKKKRVLLLIFLFLAASFLILSGLVSAQAYNQCNDSIDNDFDGIKDSSDTGCSSGNEEFNVLAPPTGSLKAGGLMWYPVPVGQSFPVDVFMLYPNYKGYLFDDQSQIMRFDVTINPPAGTQISDYKVEFAVIEEPGYLQVTSKSFTAEKNFVAAIDGTSLVNGNTYLVRFKLIRISDNAFLYEYPAYRISKVSGSLKSSMVISFDENNRILLRGKLSLILGVYDSSLDAYDSEAGWENNLTVRRRLFELPINFYNNYHYGNAPLSSMQAMSNTFQNHDIFFIHTGNCFSGSFNPSSFSIHNSDAYVTNLSAMSSHMGFYMMDECVSTLAPPVFTANMRLRNFKPDGVTVASSLSPNELHYWRDAIDLLSTDPYPMFLAEPPEGYRFSKVADWTKLTREAVKNSRPFMEVIQFFRSPYATRWPTTSELRSMSYMAITEGSNGVVYWTLGGCSNCETLAKVCSDWCPTRVEYFNRLKTVMYELKSLEPALISVDRPDLLISNTNPAIHTRVKFVNNAGYIFSFNHNGTQESTTFTWQQAPTRVMVYNESRGATLSGSSFSDSYGPYEAHVYVIDTGPDTFAPLISNVRASPGPNSSAILWSTDEPSNSLVEYGIGSGLGLSSPLSSQLTTSHSITLQGLAPDTLYYYRVKSADASQNQAASQLFSFTTPSNIAAPSCPMEAVTFPCLCGRTSITSGYCCNNVYSITPCQQNTSQPCSVGAVTSPCICGSTTISAGYCCNSTYSITECEPQACSDGEARECGIGIGICAKGIQTCANLAWSDCIGAINPTNEICNNLDDNCDGTIDEYIANCSTAQIKPLCDENWICGDWKNCSSNRRQYRDCTDLNNCSSSFNKPKTMQSCKPSSATKNTESTAKEKVEYLRNKKTLPGNKTAEMEEIGQEETGFQSNDILFYQIVFLMGFIAAALYIYNKSSIHFNEKSGPISEAGRINQKVRKRLEEAGWDKEAIERYMRRIK